MADLPLTQFTPHPRLTVKQTLISAPRFPVIDAHNHLGEFGGHWESRPFSELIDNLDRANVRIYIDLDGGWGEDVLHQHLDLFKARAPERFVLFGGVDWARWPEHGDRFGAWAAGRFRQQVARGAQGLKIWKPFGLHVCDQHGQRVAVDDARLDPLWTAAGELDVPVLMHIADPVAFFDPLDATNERYEELCQHPDWHFPSPPYPSFIALITAMKRLVLRHPATDFIGAHVGCYAENLSFVAQMLDDCPNFYVDISARISEIGRQPYTARRFFLRYADRILFGTDSGPNPAMYRLYYRFLETDDEYFDYGLAPVPSQGRWQIYGLYLPDDVLRRVYWDNAARVILRGRAHAG